VEGRYPLHNTRSNQGDAPVRQASFHKLIRCALRDHYAAVMAEPIPQRWLDVLNRLAEDEPKPRQAQAKPDRDFRKEQGHTENRSRLRESRNVSEPGDGGRVT